MGKYVVSCYDGHNCNGLKSDSQLSHLYWYRLPIILTKWNLVQYTLQTGT